MSTAQHPIHSGFDATTTATDVLAGRDLNGLNAIVTGGYSGIGLETARALAAAGVRVTVPARDTDKARVALQDIDGVEMADLDLLDPASIDAFAERFLHTGRPLHLLINSAGIMANPLTRNARGYESQFATNHLGHFQLTAKLWPALCQAQGARVVAVSSLGHRIAPVDLDDPNFQQKPYDKWQAYGQSKSANALFAVALDARGREQGIRAFSLHPGAIWTELLRHLDEDDLRRVGAADDRGRLLSREESGFKSVEQGAATQVWCATSAQLDGLGGLYCEDCDVAALLPDDSELPRGVHRWAVDPEQAELLWALSERLTGVRLPVLA